MFIGAWDLKLFRNLVIRSGDPTSAATMDPKDIRVWILVSILITVLDGYSRFPNV